MMQILSYHNVWNLNINSTVLCKILHNHVQDRNSDIIKWIEYNICVILLKCFMESRRMVHSLWNKQTLLFISIMFCNQKRSIISACVLIIAASKINAYMLRDINGLTL